MPYEKIAFEVVIDRANGDLANEVLLKAIDSLVLVYKMAVYDSAVTRSIVCDVESAEETRRDLLD